MIKRYFYKLEDSFINCVILYIKLIDFTIVLTNEYSCEFYLKL